MNGLRQPRKRRLTGPAGSQDEVPSWRRQTWLPALPLTGHFDEDRLEWAAAGAGGGPSRH
jgi:hypothetical protein